MKIRSTAKVVSSYSNLRNVEITRIFYVLLALQKQVTLKSTEDLRALE